MNTFGHFTTFKLSEIKDDKAREIIRHRIYYPTQTIAELARKLSVSRQTIYTKLQEYKSYMDLYRELQDEDINHQLNKLKDDAVKNLRILMHSGKENIRLRASIEIAKGLGIFEQYIRINETNKYPKTREEHIYKLKEIAEQEGLLLEELCRKEGINLDLIEDTKVL